MVLYNILYLINDYDEFMMEKLYFVKISDRKTNLQLKIIIKKKVIIYEFSIINRFLFHRMFVEM